MASELYCEMCGSPIRGRAYKVTLEGSQLTVCYKCYTKLQTSPGTVVPITSRNTPYRKTVEKTRKPVSRRPHHVEYEVVDDYARLIKEARERLGWTTMALAQRVMEKESVLKRIEAGRLRPSIELAKRLEKALGIKLLEPVGDADIDLDLPREDFSVTLGDAAHIKVRGKKTL